MEAGPLSQWLFSALADAELPVVCVATPHMQAVLKAQINKTDRNDARGIAQMMRVGLYRPVHVKTLRSQKLRRSPSRMICAVLYDIRGGITLERALRARPLRRHRGVRNEIIRRLLTKVDTCPPFLVANQWAAT